MSFETERKILFVFNRSPFEYSQDRDRRQFFIYSVLKDFSNIKILTFGEKDYKSEERIIVKLKSSNFKKILYFLFKLQSPRITHFQSDEFFKTLIDVLNSFKPDFIYVEHILMMRYFVNLSTKAIIVLFNDESNLFIKANSLRGGLFQILRNIRLAELEKKCCSRANLIFTITKEESKLLRKYGYKKVTYLQYPIDTNYFSFKWEKPQAKSLLFIGDYSHYPNRSAVNILAKSVLKHLRKFNVKLIIVGRNSDRLHIKDSRYFEIHNNVPDTREFYYNSSVFVAPIFVGVGIRVKILEAALCGLPIILSHIANLGINFKEDEAQVSNSIQDIIKMCTDYFQTNDTDTIENRRIKAREKIVNEFNPKKVREKVISTFFDPY